MRIRIKFRWASPCHGRPAQPDDLFATVFPRPSRRWRAMVGSLAAHGLVAALGTFVADQLAWQYADDIDWSAYRVQMVRLRVPDAVYYAPSGASQTNAAPRAVAHEPQVGPPRLPAAPRSRSQSAFELPHIATQAKENPATVLQPSAADPRPARIPPLAFWARSTETAPTPKREDVKVPGSSEAATTPPRLAAPPVLAVPNRQPELGELNMSAAPPVASPTLPVQPAATAPLRDQVADARNGALDRSRGESANVISLSSEPIRTGEVVNVPPGSDRPGSSEGGAGSNPGDTVRNGGDPGARNGPRADADGKPARGIPGRGGPDGAGQASRIQAAGASPSSSSGAADVFVRIMHPVNGSFDVVVTQAGGQSDAPGLTSRLSGNPIYTVYVPVGDVTEWILSFCVPVRKDVKNSRYEVYIEDAAPLSPPFPLTTAIPQSIIGQSRPRPLVFLGLLSASGTLHDITPSEASPVTEKITAALRDWKFRPAKKNNVPTEVEILLTVATTSN